MKERGHDALHARLHTNTHLCARVHTHFRTEARVAVRCFALLRLLAVRLYRCARMREGTEGEEEGDKMSEGGRWWLCGGDLCVCL